MENTGTLYVIAYAILNSMENLRFSKEDYFHVLVFNTGYFIKEIENIFSRVPIRTVAQKAQRKQKPHNANKKKSQRKQKSHNANKKSHNANKKNSSQRKQKSHNANEKNSSQHKQKSHNANKKVTTQTKK